MANAKPNKIILGCIRALLFVILILALGYGLLLIVIGTGTLLELDDAKEKYTSVTVQIKELRHSEGLSRSLIVVLQPDNIQPELPEQIGQTVATTSNQALSVGDRLTMYYDPADLQTRIIDFQTAEPQQRTGFILTGIAVFILLLLLLRKRIAGKRHSQPTVIAGE